MMIFDKANDDATQTHTSLYEGVMRYPTPVPLHCCTGMTMDEWADAKSKEHTTTVMPMPVVAR